MESSVNKNMSDTSENQFIKRAKASQKFDIAEKLVEYLNTNQAEKMFSVYEEEKLEETDVSLREKVITIYN